MDSTISVPSSLLGTSLGTSSLNEQASQCLQFWKAFDLESRRLSLDKTCLEMKDFKTSSINGRKKLNETTKTYRSKPAAEQLVLMNEVLREYQEEIDQLSRRSKFSESAFYHIYKALYEAPDPCPTLEGLLFQQSASSVHLLEIERLRGELTQYEKEFQQLKNQDITIRRLEEQLQEYREDIEEKVGEEVVRRVKVTEELADARIAEMRELQRAAERRLAAASDSLKQAQITADRAQSQVFEISSQAEARIGALQAENSLLAEGVQRAENKVAELERDLEQYRSSRRPEGGDDRRDAGAVEVHEILLAELRQEIHRKDEVLREERQRHESLSRELSAQLSRERDAASKLRQELVARPLPEDFVALKRQLKVLQKAAFNIQEEDEDPEHTAVGEDKVQFEVLLTARLKALESELAETRHQLNDTREQERRAQAAAASLRTSLDASVTLVKRLEADLELHTSKSLRPLLRPDLSSRPSDGSFGLTEILESKPSPATGGEGGPQQLVAILQAQRDRYKERLGQTESSAQSLQQLNDQLAAAKASLEADNLALFAKLRFFQSSYKSARVGARDEEAGFGRTEVERKYQAVYEKNISPFNEFNQFEKMRKYNELSVADRIVLNTTMAVVSSPTGRNFLLVYLAAMHLLVFLTLYYSASRVHYGCDPAIDLVLQSHSSTSN